MDDTLHLNTPPGQVDLPGLDNLDGNTKVADPSENPVSPPPAPHLGRN